MFLAVLLLRIVLEPLLANVAARASRLAAAVDQAEHGGACEVVVAASVEACSFHIRFRYPAPMNKTSCSLR